MTSGDALRIGLVAGEPSGDRLGAELIRALRARQPEAQFFGMAGDAMLDAGCEALAHSNELSVMGIAEVLRSYPRLRRLRGHLRQELARRRPHVVVGIDVPDFNLGLEQRLKTAGIATVHYVGPQMWAWREGRARQLATAVDQLLVLFPFEEEFFTGHGVATTFVGHPLADRLDPEPDRELARTTLGVAPESTMIALLPGSRRQELARMLEPFLAASSLLRRSRPDLEIVVCLAAERDRAAAAAAAERHGARLLTGRSTEVLTAADVALVASGTATLEALLCGVPMAVGYRMAPLSYHIIRAMVKVRNVALPNILHGSELVPELIQGAMHAEALAAAVTRWLDDSGARVAYARQSRAWHQRLRRGASDRAAEAVLELVARS